MKIEVVIPVVNTGLARDLLLNIHKNTKVPNRVILIDNTKEDQNFLLPHKFKVSVLQSETGMVNESLELGRKHVTPDCDLIAFLNDDLILGDWFFQRVVETFEAHSDRCAIACGHTVKTIPEVAKGRVIYKKQGYIRMDGWSFVIRKDVLDSIPPLPYDRVETFAGDLWIWEHCRKKGYYWAKDMGNTLYHYVGVSILKFGLRNMKKKEANEWTKMKQEIWEGS